MTDVVCGGGEMCSKCDWKYWINIGDRMIKSGKFKWTGDWTTTNLEDMIWWVNDNRHISGNQIEVVERLQQEYKANHDGVDWDA